MESQYEIVFQPKGRDSEMIIQRQDTLLSVIRSEDDTLNDYFFLNKDGKIIQKKYQKKYKIADVLNKNNQIVMSKKQEGKNSQQTNENSGNNVSQSIEIYLVFENENRKDLIKIQPETTLEELQKLNEETTEYYFLNTSKNPIKPSFNKKYTVKEVLQGNQIHLRKKEDSNEPKKQEKTYLIQFKETKQKKIQIRASEKDVLSVLRKNPQLEKYVFLSQGGERISHDSQSRTKIEEISIKNTIFMKPKVDLEGEETKSEAKRKQIQQQQQKRIQSLGKLMEDIKGLKGNINKDGNQQRMAEIAKRLKEEGIPIQPEKLSQQHSIKSILSTLEGKESSYQNILEYAKKTQDRSQAESYASNGLILPTIYNTVKKETETINLIDFTKSKKTVLDKQKRAYKMSVVEYEATQNSTVRVDLSKTSQYEFNGGSLNVSAWAVSAKVSTGKAELHQTENVTTKRGVQKNQRVNQTFLAFAITNAIFFHEDQIVLKSEVVEKFEAIVGDYKESGNANLLEENLQKFINKYGVGINSSVYLLGGIYNNTISYQFFTETTNTQLSTIIRNQSEFSLGVAVGGSYGAFSAEAGYQHNTKSTDEKGWTDKKTNKKINYKTIYYHQASPLSSIHDINLWRETIQAFPQNWVVVGHKDKTEISLSTLLRSPLNSINLKPDFLSAKEKVLQSFENAIKEIVFKFEFEPRNQFLIKNNQLKKGGDPSKQYQILGNTQFPLQKRSSYKIQISHSQQMQIAIGICCLSCKDNEYSRPKYNEVIYYRLAGMGTIQVKNEKIKSNIIVKNGNIVRVVVDTGAMSSISWFVQEKLVGKVSIPVEMLLKGIYPYFQMFSNNDVIKIL